MDRLFPLTGCPSWAPRVQACSYHKGLFLIRTKRSSWPGAWSWHEKNGFKIPHCKQPGQSVVTDKPQGGTRGSDFCSLVWKKRGKSKSKPIDQTVVHNNGPVMRLCARVFKKSKTGHFRTPAPVSSRSVIRPSLSTRWEAVTRSRVAGSRPQLALIKSKTTQFRAGLDRD